MHLKEITTQKQTMFCDVKNTIPVREIIQRLGPGKLKMIMVACRFKATYLYAYIYKEQNHMNKKNE